VRSRWIAPVCTRACRRRCVRGPRARLGSKHALLFPGSSYSRVWACSGSRIAPGSRTKTMTSASIHLNAVEYATRFAAIPASGPPVPARRRRRALPARRVAGRRRAWGGARATSRGGLLVSLLFADIVALRGAAGGAACGVVQSPHGAAARTASIAVIGASSGYRLSSPQPRPGGDSCSSVGALYWPESVEAGSSRPRGPFSDRAFASAAVTGRSTGRRRSSPPPCSCSRLPEIEEGQRDLFGARASSARCQALLFSAGCPRQAVLSGYPLFRRRSAVSR
jgi:hypothetical protein